MKALLCKHGRHHFAKSQVLDLHLVGSSTSCILLLRLSAFQFPHKLIVVQIISILFNISFNIFKYYYKTRMTTYHERILNSINALIIFKSRNQPQDAHFFCISGLLDHIKLGCYSHAIGGYNSKGLQPLGFIFMGSKCNKGLMIYGW